MSQVEETMQAIVVGRPGDADVLQIADVPRPSPCPGEVLIQVAAAGVNRADIAQRKGHYPPPAGISDILGMEVSGHVAAVGANMARWKVGDSVCALLGGGGYAEYCVVPQGQVLPVPQGVSLIDAASLPEAAFTVWANLFDTQMLRAHETFLVQGGSSGIGSFAIQAARFMVRGSSPPQALGRSASSAVNWVPRQLGTTKKRTGWQQPGRGQRARAFR